MDEIINTEDFTLLRNTQATKVPLICVYKNPSDYPGKYVARLWDEDRPTNMVCVANSYQEIVLAKPPEMVVMPREQTDDPVIVETWI